MHVSNVHGGGLRPEGRGPVPFLQPHLKQATRALEYNVCSWDGKGRVELSQPVPSDSNTRLLLRPQSLEIRGGSPTNYELLLEVSDVVRPNTRFLLLGFRFGLIDPLGIEEDIIEPELLPSQSALRFSGLLVNTHYQFRNLNSGGAAILHGQPPAEPVRARPPVAKNPRELVLVGAGVTDGVGQDLDIFASASLPSLPGYRAA